MHINIFKSFRKQNTKLECVRSFSEEAIIKYNLVTPRESTNYVMISTMIARLLMLAELSRESCCDVTVIVYGKYHCKLMIMY